jgi:hypothetical protein
LILEASVSSGAVGFFGSACAKSVGTNKAKHPPIMQALSEMNPCRGMLPFQPLAKLLQSSTQPGSFIVHHNKMNQQMTD